MCLFFFHFPNFIELVSFPLAISWLKLICKHSRHVMWRAPSPSALNGSPRDAGKRFSQDAFMSNAKLKRSHPPRHWIWKSRNYWKIKFSMMNFFLSLALAPVSPSEQFSWRFPMKNWFAQCFLPFFAFSLRLIFFPLALNFPECSSWPVIFIFIRRRSRFHPDETEK